METGATWKITEIEAPAGYVLNPTPQTVKIVNDVTYRYHPQRSEAGPAPDKIDADTRKPVMGAKFTFTHPRHDYPPTPA